MNTCSVVTDPEAFGGNQSANDLLRLTDAPDALWRTDPEDRFSFVCFYFLISGVSDKTPHNSGGERYIQLVVFPGVFCWCDAV